MSKIFYDHLLDLDKVENTVKKAASSHEERMELWQLIDEIIHHRVMGCILDYLPGVHHEEFLQKFSEGPHDEKLLDYLKEKIKEDIVALIKEVVAALVLELIDYNSIDGKGKATRLVGGFELADNQKRANNPGK
jgi:hypothetical protein